MKISKEIEEIMNKVIELEYQNSCLIDILSEKNKLPVDSQNKNYKAEFDKLFKLAFKYTENLISCAGGDPYKHTEMQNSLYDLRNYLLVLRELRP